jgi:hypothetical protein
MFKSKLAKTLLVITILLAMSSGAQAATLSAGTYNMFINTWANSTTTLKSAFAYNKDPSTCTNDFLDCVLVDNDVLVRGMGSSIGDDGYAGVINITVGGSGAFTVNSFNLDSYLYAVGGHFAVWADSVAGMNGSIDAGGNIQFNPTGRVATMQFFSAFDNGGMGTPFYVDNSAFIPGHTGSGLYYPFTTGTSCNLSTVTGATNLCLTGQALDNNGNAVLVSLGNLGADWGSFDGVPYAEIYSVHVEAVPVPAAAWLFGSGLLGLLGFWRLRRKS